MSHLVLCVSQDRCDRRPIDCTRKKGRDCFAPADSQDVGVFFQHRVGNVAFLVEGNNALHDILVVRLVLQAIVQFTLEVITISILAVNPPKQQRR